MARVENTPDSATLMLHALQKVKRCPKHPVIFLCFWGCLYLFPFGVTLVGEGFFTISWADADLWGAENITGTTFHKLLHMTASVPDFDTATPCYPQPCMATDSLRAALYKTPSQGMSPTQLMNVPWVKHHWKKCVYLLIH